MIPLQLTGREQSCLAELCAIVHGEAYYVERSPNRFGERIVDWLDKWELTPQELGAMYDKLHRSGANS